MINRDLIKNARKNLEQSVSRHQTVSKRAIERCNKLYKLRKVAAHDLVGQVEKYINSMKTTPAGFDNAIAEYRMNFSAFDHVILDFDKSVKDSNIKSTAGAGAGVAAGAATALLGPTTAMAVATTFGTASTGTAISALSGAAATNAALAWLGGGAIAAGGGGMSAGGVLLGLAGPVGWGLAGAAVAGGALYMRSANGKAAGEADQKRLNVEAEIRSMEASEAGIIRLQDLTETVFTGLYVSLVELRDTLKVTEAKGQPDQIMEKLGAMVNHVRTLGQLLVKTVDLKAA